MGRISVSYSFWFSESQPIAPANAGTTLESVKADGALTCGIDTEEPEYSTQDAHGNHGAFDLDLCKAVAVAVLGPNAKLVIAVSR